jgi:hypothetical protein
MKKINSLIIIAVSVLIISCKKNNTGGECEVAAFPQHHGKSIYGATVYVKFGAKDLPNDPTSNYDLKVEGEPDEEHVHIKNLRYGHYYLYAVGYDSSIAQTVVGGLALKIKWKERKKEIDVNVPVTED